MQDAVLHLPRQVGANTLLREFQEAVAKLRAGHSIPPEAGGLLADVIENVKNVEVGSTGWRRVGSRSTSRSSILRRRSPPTLIRTRRKAPVLPCSPEGPGLLSVLMKVGTLALSFYAQRSFILTGPQHKNDHHEG